MIQILDITQYKTNINTQNCVGALGTIKYNEKARDLRCLWCLMCWNVWSKPFLHHWPRTRKRHRYYAKAFVDVIVDVKTVTCWATVTEASCLQPLVQRPVFFDAPLYELPNGVHVHVWRHWWILPDYFQHKMICLKWWKINKISYDLNYIFD